MQVDRIMLLFYHTHMPHKVRDARENWHEIVDIYVLFRSKKCNYVQIKAEIAVLKESTQVHARS